MTTELKKLSMVETLTQARDLLVKEGWTQGDYARRRVDGTCERCALGALENWSVDRTGRYSQGWGEYVYGARKHLERAMREIDPPSNNNYPFSITWWNDLPGRTQDQVLAAFNLAIENAKKQEEA